MSSGLNEQLLFSFCIVCSSYMCLLRNFEVCLRAVRIKRLIIASTRQSPWNQCTWGTIGGLGLLTRQLLRLSELIHAAELGHRAISCATCVWSILCVLWAAASRCTAAVPSEPWRMVIACSTTQAGVWSQLNIMHCQQDLTSDGNASIRWVILLLSSSERVVYM